MRILVTAGPTREHFDTVRFISNASSGKMGYAIAEAAASCGHEVVLVSGPVELAAPDRVEVVRVTSAQEMFDVCVREFEHCNAAVMAAAVSDYRPVESAGRKGAKSDRAIQVTLAPTPDICAHLGSIKHDRVVVGFALEDYDARAHAEDKLRRKNCDAIILNHVSTLTSDMIQFEVFELRDGWSAPFSGDKNGAARRIVGLVERLTPSC